MTESGEVRDKPALLAMVRDERQRLDAVVGSLDDATLTRDGVIEGSSVKDVLAHIAAWEQRIVAGIESALRGQTPAWPEPGWTMDRMDELNDRDFAANHDRPLRDVRAGARESYERTLVTVESLDERDLFDGGRFAWTRGTPLWRFVDANTSEHCREHREAIQAWLASKGS